MVNAVGLASRTAVGRLDELEEAMLGVLKDGQMGVFDVDIWSPVPEGLRILIWWVSLERVMVDCKTKVLIMSIGFGGGGPRPYK